MPITRKKKEELLADYTAYVAKSPAIVFTNYKGVTVAQLRSLRAKLKDSGTTFVVVKNSLLTKAFEKNGRTPPEALLSGQNAVAFIGEDIGKGVTGLKEWIKDAKILTITGAVLESSILNAGQAESLSDLPTKEQTLAAILGTINAPASTLARIIAAPGASLARVINAYVESRKEAEAA